MEVPIKLAAYYGLRRSEVLGLRWQAIDFGQETISIEHVLLRFLRGLQNSRSNIVIAETRDYFPESQMRFIPPIHACFLKEHIQQMKIGSRQHPLPAEKKTLSGKPYLYNKEKNR